MWVKKEGAATLISLFCRVLSVDTLGVIFCPLSSASIASLSLHSNSSWIKDGHHSSSDNRFLCLFCLPKDLFRVKKMNVQTS